MTILCKKKKRDLPIQYKFFTRPSAMGAFLIL